MMKIASTTPSNLHGVGTYRCASPSRPFEPHPLFASFIQAAVVQSRLV